MYIIILQSLETEIKTKREVPRMLEISLMERDKSKRYSSVAPVQVKHAQLDNKTTVAEPKGEKLREYSSVAQWRSNRLLTGRLLVRVQPGEFFIAKKFVFLPVCLFFKYLTVQIIISALYPEE